MRVWTIQPEFMFEEFERRKRLRVCKKMLPLQEKTDLVLSL